MQRFPLFVFIYASILLYSTKADMVAVATYDISSCDAQRILSDRWYPLTPSCWPASDGNYYSYVSASGNITGESFYKYKANTRVALTGSHPFDDDLISYSIYKKILEAEVTLF